MNLTVSSKFLRYLPRSYSLVFLSVGAPLTLCRAMLSSLFVAMLLAVPAQVVMDNPKLNFRQINQFLLDCM